MKIKALDKFKLQENARRSLYYFKQNFLPFLNLKSQFQLVDPKIIFTCQ